MTSFVHFYAPGARTGDALAPCLTCGEYPTDARIDPDTELGDHPCFCVGPWRDVDPADRPETVLGREHATGSSGCEYRQER